MASHSKQMLDRRGVDRLTRRGLPHPSQCVLCDQENESIQHTLTSYVFACEFWCKIFTPSGFTMCVPGRHEHVFAEWRKARKDVPKDSGKGFNTMVILGTWLLWKHRSTCVFEVEGARSCMHNLARAFENECHFWCLASARALSTVWLRASGLGLPWSGLTIKSLFNRFFPLCYTSPLTVWPGMRWTICKGSFLSSLQ
jgi:hypothetical protein